MNAAVRGASSTATCVPDARSLVSINRRLAALKNSGDIASARRLFDSMHERDSYSYNTIIAALASSGDFATASDLFFSSPYTSSTVPWSSLISAHARHGSATDALRLFRRMLSIGLRPDHYTLGAALRACSIQSLLFSGEQIHSLAAKTAFAGDSFVAAGLVDVYAKCEQIQRSYKIFEEIPENNINNRVLWTAMVAGQTKNGDTLGALENFRRMISSDLRPNKFTLPSVLASCAAERALFLGSQIHTCALRSGLLNCAFVRSALVNMYASCSEIHSAKDVLESVQVDDDSVCWNALIVRCSRTGMHEYALKLFVEMRKRGLEMDEFTYPSALNSTASVNDTYFGRTIHGSILQSGLGAQEHVGNALVDMYAKCAMLEDARDVFDEMLHRDIVGWTALITGHAQHGFHDSVVSIFLEMLAFGVELDEYITAGILKSCAELTLLEVGRQFHSTILKRRFDAFNSVANSLVTLYAKTGCIVEAKAIFGYIHCPDAITWTALIVGHAQNGHGYDSIRLYDEMVRSGIQPDYVTFIGLLFACSHAGLVDLGRSYFDSMNKVYGISPGPDHYVCMIDLLGRSGRVREAVVLVNQMQSRPDATVWKALLAACRVYGDMDTAEFAAGELFKLDPNDASGYVLLSNIYSSARRWSDVAKIRSLLKSRVAGKKEPGCSWIEVAGGVHLFHVEDRGHPQTVEIYSKLEEMIERIREAGYIPNVECTLQDVGEEGRKAGLLYHSEKLAVAYALLSLPQGVPIRVFKNLRVCVDCHSALKLVAQVYGRRIVLRDSNCFHHMNEGLCSCGDYW